MDVLISSKVIVIKNTSSGGPLGPFIWTVVSKMSSFSIIQIQFLGLTLVFFFLSQAFLNITGKLIHRSGSKIIVSLCLLWQVDIRTISKYLSCLSWRVSFKKFIIILIPKFLFNIQSIPIIIKFLIKKYKFIKIFRKLIPSNQEFFNFNAKSMV